VITRLAAGAAFLLVLVISGVARADGGDSIANAPELPLGQEVQGGNPGNGCSDGEFWRVTLVRGDHAKLDFSSLNGATVVLNLYAPSVTDYTFSGDGGYITNAGTGSRGKGELLYTAPAPGRYTIYFRTASCGPQLAYTLIGYVQHYTAVTLAAPRVARAHSPVLLKGKVSGISAGKVAIQAVIKKRWKTLGLVRVLSNGSFSYPTRVGPAGTYRVRVVFFGDATHLPSKAARVIRVV
jgi:hypothetical protein